MSVQDAYAPPRSVVRDVAGGSGLMSERVVASLRKTRPWVLFIAILGFIGAAFTLIASIPMLLGGGMMGMGGMGGLDAGAGFAGTGFMIGMGVMYLLIAVLYFIASLYLLRYANAIKRAVTGLNASDMEAALEAQASFWKLVGILAIVSIVLMIVFMVVGFGSLFMMSSNLPSQ
ncbi:DUF5362 family protein [uncultured Thiothrix sp.]|uniref:DUF5362 family protein n=1 Tax=uncultured Thiothrix sp. TaxID=223185 RepID=UPI002623E803|nr:DUF5362 family protein [uncultured Thiothrix sp.]